MLTMLPNDVIASYIDKYHWVLHSVQRTITASKSMADRRIQ
ncbi:MAG: hypothetical protein RR066_07795 [Mucinivorans sp.]